jgi:hypothetical protein
LTNFTTGKPEQMEAGQLPRDAGKRERMAAGQRPRDTVRRGDSRILAFQHDIAIGGGGDWNYLKREEDSGERYV